MTNIRRFFRDNDIAFLTHVTFNRMPILIDYAELLTQSMNQLERKSGCEIIAWVILPDHFHIMIDSKGGDISSLIRRLKLSFSTRYRKVAGLYSGRIWQYRFWDHIIRDQDDMNRHLDYIHFNPLKHSYVKNPFEWKYSSIHKYLQDDGWDYADMDFAGEFWRMN